MTSPRDTNLLDEQPHRRFNPLIQEWILISPHRAKRPWQGQTETPTPDERPHYDPGCYLCPGNIRANGEINPHYESTYVFDNDFPALLPDSPAGDYHPHELVHAQGEQGTTRVLCFSPRHDLTLAQMDTATIRTVVDLWVNEYRTLADRDYISYVQVFETRGAMMGSSNPHPHGQVWASAHLPQIVQAEDDSQRAYFAEHGRSLLSDYLDFELRALERIVYENDTFVVLVPFWAYWPYETMVLPRRHVSGMTDFTDAERDGLADALRNLTVRYDNIFRTSFPYASGFHQRPVKPESNGGNWEHWQWHAHYYPPLLRSATVRKFTASYELLGTLQRDLTAEQGAARIREQSDVHFTLVG